MVQVKLVEHAMLMIVGQCFPVVFAETLALLNQSNQICLIGYLFCTHQFICTEVSLACKHIAQHPSHLLDVIEHREHRGLLDCTGKLIIHIVRTENV